MRPEVRDASYRLDMIEHARVSCGHCKAGRSMTTSATKTCGWQWSGA